MKGGREMLKKYLSNQKGFTMIEMMVVLIIIAVLIGGGIKFYIGYVDKAKVTKAKGEMATMQAALDSYYAEKGKYPTSNENLVEAGLATDMVSIATGEGIIYQYGSTDSSNNKKYEITTVAEFKNGKQLKGEGENGESTPPNFPTP